MVFARYMKTIKTLKITRSLHYQVNFVIKTILTSLYHEYYVLKIREPIIKNKIKSFLIY
jgi:hypothetical protein